jgi:hypothetical protein
MDFGQVIQKASVACFSSGRRSEDHFVDATQMVSHCKPLGRENGL